MANEIEPGSWRVVERETELLGMRRVEIWHNGLSIAGLNMRHYPSALENGRRMAAAPDLLAAVMRQHRMCVATNHPGVADAEWCEPCCMARAAIAKANGETP